MGERGNDEYPMWQKGRLPVGSEVRSVSTFLSSTGRQGSIDMRRFFWWMSGILGLTNTCGGGIAASFVGLKGREGGGIGFGRKH